MTTGIDSRHLADPAGASVAAKRNGALKEPALDGMDKFFASSIAMDRSSKSLQGGSQVAASIRKKLILGKVYHVVQIKGTALRCHSDLEIASKVDRQGQYRGQFTCVA